MKKFLALALAIVMMAAIAVPAFAAEFTEVPSYTDFTESILWEETRYGDGNDDKESQNYLTDANDSEEENTRIEYGVAQAYTVTIPADIRLYEFTAESTANQTKGYVYGQETISVSDVVIAGDEELNIYLSSSQYDDTNGWTLKDSEGTMSSADVNYKIKVEDSDTVNAANYIADYDAATTGLVLNGTDSTVAASRILNQAVATGNAGTLGSTNTVQLYFSSKGTAQEGTFRDVLTFTVRIETVVTGG